LGYAISPGLICKSSRMAVLAMRQPAEFRSVSVPQWFKTAKPQRHGATEAPAKPLDSEN